MKTMMGLITPPSDPAQKAQIEARLGLDDPAGTRSGVPLQTLFFTNGVYDPAATRAGQRLMNAHELTHTVQQSRNP